MKLVKFSFVLFYIFINQAYIYPLGIGAYGLYSINGSTYASSWALNGKNRSLFWDRLAMTGINTTKPTNHIAGGGLILDTNCSNNKKFNYRLKAGAARIFSNSIYSNDLTHLSLNSIFGFSLHRNETYRLWMGPQIGLFYVFGSGTFYTLDHFMSEPDTVVIINDKKARISLGGANVGVVLGNNINFNRSITLSIEANFFMPIYLGNGTYQYRSYVFSNVISAPMVFPMRKVIDKSLRGVGVSFEATIAVLCRVNESYNRE